MIVITSAEYIKQDLQVEFGVIPPSFLPLGNKRLYEYQIATLIESFDDNIVLSLPYNYELSEQDSKRLEVLRVHVEYVPEGISLSESLLYVINSTGYYKGPIRVLHGDTLIEGLPKEQDVIGVSPTHYEYDWEFEDSNDNAHENENLVWCGFFSFSDAKLFTRLLTITKKNFVEAVREYDNNKSLSKERLQQWYDFGHSNTYFKSRSIKTTEREFNSLIINNGIVRKSGSKKDKIIAEYNWFKSLPWELKRFTPQLLDYGTDQVTQQPFYLLEYLSANPLNELYVYGENSIAFWDRVFGHCGDFLKICEKKMDYETKLIKYKELTKESKILLEQKTYDRLKDYSDSTGFNLEKEIVINNRVFPSITEIANLCIEEANKHEVVPGILHGDFCFSNILYDSRTDLIKVLDPRGMNHSGKTIFGDLRYDIAKLTHSVIGLYDYIISGVIDFKINSSHDMNLNFYHKERITSIQTIFVNKTFTGQNISVQSILPITILLFLSMLPLHSDNEKRQSALLANGVRLFNLYQEGFYDSNSNGRKKLEVF